LKSNLINWQIILSSIILGVLAILSINLLYEIIFYPGRYSLYNNFWLYLWGIGIVYLILIILCITHKKLNKFSPWNTNTSKRFLLQLILDSMTTLLVAIPLGLIASKYFSEDNEIDMPADVVIIGSVVLFFIFIYSLLDLSNFFFKRWKDSLINVEKFKKENIEYRFDRLKEQLNPHFLFNNLNTLYGLINENPKIASEFVLELSDIYRYVLKSKDEKIVRLKEELNFAESYAFLLSKRFPNSINVEISLQPEIFDTKIPPMTIQMLIENAIKHNSYDSDNPLNIRVYQANTRKIIIENSIQLKNREENSNKVGLLNLKQRYGYLTNQNIEIIRTGKKFTVKLPVIN
jgi:two-component system LytT family sensor kinase